MYVMPMGLEMLVIYTVLKPVYTLMVMDFHFDSDEFDNAIIPKILIYIFRD